MEDGLVYNAMDGAKKLGITPDELGKKYDALKKGEGIIKFGGGFYCGKVDDIYVPHLMLSLFWGLGRWCSNTHLTGAYPRKRSDSKMHILSSLRSGYRLSWYYHGSLKNGHSDT